MAVEKVQMFTVVCDNCKLDIGENSDYSCWNHVNFAEDVAMDSDWLIHDGKHHCPDCYKYDDNDELIIKTERKDLYNEEN